MIGFEAKSRQTKKYNGVVIQNCHKKNKSSKIKKRMVANLLS